MSGNMAFNPLPWFMTAEGWRDDLAPPLPAMLSAIKAAGYDGVHAEVPKGSTPQAYLSLLSDHGLLPAPGYFQASFGDADDDRRHDRKRAHSRTRSRCARPRPHLPCRAVWRDARTLRDARAGRRRQRRPTSAYFRWHWPGRLGNGR